MNIRTVLAVLISFAFLMASCGTQATPEPTQAPTETLTPIPPTETPTLTPSPEPTSTPTITPTPIGGKDGLLLYQITCDQDVKCEQKIFLYNLVSQELVPFLDGYELLDISPDGKKALLLKYKKTIGEPGDLFILDLAQPEKMTLLQENVEDAVWLGDSDWIGFISKVNGKRQGFILHPDGSELTQVTKSSVGVWEIKPVFNDGIFWSEGTRSGRRISITANKWTKLDGSEKKISNFSAVSPNGKYVITNSMSNQNNFELIDSATGETKEVSLSKPDADAEFHVVGLRPLTENKWIISSYSPTLNAEEFYIYSSDGTSMAKFPNGYRVVANGGSSSLLSPDGIWILIEHYEKISNEQSKTTYYLFNTVTSEIKDTPNLYAFETGGKVVGDRYVIGEIEGCLALIYFWVEIP